MDPAGHQGGAHFVDELLYAKGTGDRSIRSTRGSLTAPEQGQQGRLVSLFEVVNASDATGDWEIQDQ
jgi:hypothetical protein